MAENESRHMFCSSELCNSLLCEIRRCLKEYDILHTNVCVVRRTRDLQEGDFCVPKGCLPDLSEQILEGICNDLKNSSKGHFLQLHNVTSTKHYGFAFYLERPLALKSSLMSMWNQDGLVVQSLWSSSGCGKQVLVNLSGCHGNKDAVDTLDDLRSAVITQHLTQLLKEAGYGVGTICNRDLKTVTDFLELAVKSQLKYQDDLCCEQFKDFVTGNKYCVEKDKLNVCRGDGIVSSKYAKLDESRDDCSENSKTDEDCLTVQTSEIQKTFTVDLRQFLEDKKMTVGRNGYDKNLTFAEICSSKEVASSTYVQACQLHKAKSQHPVDTLVHVVADSGYFAQQRVDLTSRVLWPEQDTHAQVYLVHGPVKTRRHSPVTDKVISAEDFIQFRCKQMKTAAVMKYGDEVNGPGWEATITALTCAGVKFEMLNTVHRNPVKLDLTDEESGHSQDNRSGSFVMYNCARLATLFKHFEEAVTRGYYPCLPEISKVDFGLLREEDEWSLFFHYILPYPDIVREAIEELVPQSGITTKMHTHKICNFLINFSHNLSSYYSRTHVLGENRPHLLPVMYARLYLLKVVYKILTHALGLLDIEPLLQL